MGELRLGSVVNIFFLFFKFQKLGTKIINDNTVLRFFFAAVYDLDRNTLTHIKHIKTKASNAKRQVFQKHTHTNTYTHIITNDQFEVTRCQQETEFLNSIHGSFFD